MNSSRGKQDVLRCDLCETSMPLLHCDICHVNLCKPCVGEHALDETKDHTIVPFKKRGSTPKCLKHFSKICELHCEQCDCPICALCVSSFDHEQHFKVDIFKKFEEKKAALQKDIQELENLIYPKYQDIVSEVPIYRKDLNKNSQNLKAAINKQGRDLHREVDSVKKKMKANVDDINSKYMAYLKKREDEITGILSEIQQNISDMKKLLDSYDVCQVCAYKSKNAVFRKLPPKLTVCLPKFIPHQIDEAEINQQIGVLLELRVKTEEYDHIFTSSEVVTTLPKRPLMVHPIVMTDFLTESGNNSFCHVSCVSNKEIWISGCDEFLRLYNLEGKLVKSIKTKSGNVPIAIAIIRFDDLIYADNYDRSLNIVKGTEVHTMIKLHGWRPLGVCSSSSDELLLLMINDSNNQTKVVRYSGSTEKQSIQFEDKGKTLLSPTGSYDFPTCICENKNFDICVADKNAKAVVIVDQNWKLRFRYTSVFPPVGIVTDSQSRILISDHIYNIIHILNQDGRLLRYIDNCFLQCPLGLCLDNNDNLFVAESAIGKVTKIQYCSM
ncbi:uncharacterized protein LOC128170508 [Crassostrea angulata]|uniref:uncharacterized protein LOC128170508 n=1 Tax=Magallana angulata TaxID=2784310 RepID=UPI0022B1C597|nr:uncharacterized protein LOC128170508 [Crassostrea angulata]